MRVQWTAIVHTLVRRWAKLGWGDGSSEDDSGSRESVDDRGPRGTQTGSGWVKVP